MAQHNQLSLFALEDSPVMKQTEDLFGAWLDARQNSPRPLRPSSVQVYTAMWTSIFEFLVAQNLELRCASEAEMSRILQHIGGSPSYQKRLLILIDDIYKHAVGISTPSPARLLMKDPRFRFADTRSAETIPVTLNQIQEHELIKELTRRIKEGKWKRQRDIAMAATVLAAGIKPGEAVQLKLVQVSFDGLDSTKDGLPAKLALPGNGNNGPRECPIAKWGQSILRDWLDTRVRLQISTMFVFPSAISVDEPIAQATFYRQFGKLLADLGIVTQKRGAHVLRHTFAVRQLEQGKREREVQDWLGLEDNTSISIYRKVSR